MRPPPSEKGRIIKASGLLCSGGGVYRWVVVEDSDVRPMHYLVRPWTDRAAIRYYLRTHVVRWLAARRDVITPRDVTAGRLVTTSVFLAKSICCSCCTYSRGWEEEGDLRTMLTPSLPLWSANYSPCILPPAYYNAAGLLCTALEYNVWAYAKLGLFLSPLNCIQSGFGYTPIAYWKYLVHHKNGSNIQ